MCRNCGKLQEFQKLAESCVNGVNLLKLHKVATILRMCRNVKMCRNWDKWQKTTLICRNWANVRKSWNGVESLEIRKTKR